MRRVLDPLTRRGKALVVAGLLALLTAWLIGARDLLRLSVLLLLLPAMSAVLVARTRYRLACARGMSPARVPVGTTATSVVRLENVSRLPSGVLMVEDTVPAALGPAPRFVVDRLEPGGAREVTTPVEGVVRGRWTVGPVRVRLVDPFGLCATSRAFTATDQLVVTPHVHPLPVLRLGGTWTGLGESRHRSLADTGDDDVVPREYRTGDDLRRVHWRATARAGELMVRREERPWGSRATVLLDLRRRGHAGSGPTSSLEIAVSAAASIALHLSRHGYSVRVVDIDGEDLVPDLTAGDVEGLLLDSLAAVTATESLSVAAHGASLRRALGDGLLVAVVGRLDGPDSERVARIRHGAATGLAIVLDAAGWGGAYGSVLSPDAIAEGAVLGGSGWRVSVAGPGTGVVDAWAALSAGASGGAASGRGSRLGTSGPAATVRTAVGGAP